MLLIKEPHENTGLDISRVPYEIMGCEEWDNMVRPRMCGTPKVPASVSIEQRVLEEARRLPSGKMSEICNKALREYLLMPLDERRKKCPLDGIDGEKAETAKRLIGIPATAWAKTLSDVYANKLQNKKLTKKDIYMWLANTEGGDNGTDGKQDDPAGARD